MTNSRLNALLLAGCVSLAAVGAASAGGFSRGTADTDILFEEGNFNMRSSVTIVSPNRSYTDAGQLPGQSTLVGDDYADTYAIPSAAVKFRILDQLSCAGTLSQPYGGDTTHPFPGTGTLYKLDEDFVVTEYGATCAAQFDMGKGRISFLGGVFAETVDYTLVGGSGDFTVELEDKDIGWRAGIAYEIPEIALRAQLLYRSGTSVEATGTTNGIPVAEGYAELPQSVELKLQSGIAPGWLAFGSVKWTDWSVNEQLILVLSPGNVFNNYYYWRDGWTVTGGIGHAFNDSVSGSLFATWDRGVGNGWDLQSDTYTVGSGVSVKDKLGGELRAGVGVSYLTAIEETQYEGFAPSDPSRFGFNRAVGNDWSFAFSAGYAVKW